MEAAFTAERAESARIALGFSAFSAFSAVQRRSRWRLRIEETWQHGNKMEMRSLVITFLLLDALVVLVVGLSTLHGGGSHGEHNWDFFLVNGLRLAVTGAIVALWGASGNRRLARILFGKRPAQE